MGHGAGLTLMDRIRRKPILFILAVSVLLFYVSPFYYYKSLYVSFPVICKNASCQQATSATAGMALSLWDTESHPDYLVYSRGCKIMEMDPFDKSVKKFLKTGKPMKCNQRIAKMENQKLIIDDKFVKSWKTKKPSCCHRAIYRVEQKSDKYNKDADWGIKYSGVCHPIPLGSGGSSVNDSFVKVECKGSSSGKVKGNDVEFHGIPLHPKTKSEKTRRKAEYWDERRAKGLANPPNILIIGVDSISRMHMMRSLPKTRDFILQNDFIELKGYTKIGENTFPNIMAGFGGMELNNYSSCWPNKTAKLDDCPYVWKNFSELNYMTAFLEDSPGIAIFNYVKYGFVLPPADYYVRPLTVAMHKYHGWARGTGRSDCVGGRNPTDFQANFIRDLIAKMGKDYPYFLFSWFTSVGHDDFNGLKTADDAFLSLFQGAMKNVSANPDNTVIIFMSDHGYRFGSFRETFLGFYEESLPFFFFRLPPSLKSIHPDWYTNLRRNSQQLTSPLDLHSTLKQILYSVQTDLASNHTSPSSSDPNKSMSSVDIQLLDGDELMTNLTEYTFYNTSSSDPINLQFRPRYSFFEFIPDNRTCESSSIPQRYCMCGVTPVMSSKSSLSSHLGDIVVSHINYLLQTVITSGKCATLKFSKFLYGREVGHGEIWNNFNQLIGYKDYLVALEATPSKAHFEAKLRILQNSTTRILGDITRINAYKGQSECIADFKLKSYCFCKNKKERAEKHVTNAEKPKSATKHASTIKPTESTKLIGTTKPTVTIKLTGVIKPTATIKITETIKPTLHPGGEHISLKLNSTEVSLRNLTKGNNTDSRSQHTNKTSFTGTPK